VERRVVGFAEMLVVVRSEEGDKRKDDDDLSHAERTTAPEECTRGAKAEHRIAEDLKRGKSEAGLGDDQVRNWRGWHHPMALSLIATWFLVGEAWRGKKRAPALMLPQARAGLAMIVRKA
jgi:SRSO17 transposase